MAWEIYKTRAACRGRLQNTEWGLFWIWIELNQIFKVGTYRILPLWSQSIA
jgi:hypothetical protein